MKKTTPQTCSLLYLDSKLYIKTLKRSLSNFDTITKGGLLGLDHTREACKGHPMHITTPTKPHLYLLGDPLVVLPGLQHLLGHMHLSSIPIHLASHFNLMLYHNLSGIHNSRGGGPNTTMLQLYFLHHLPNHNSYTLLHPSNCRCLPCQI